MDADYFRDLFAYNLWANQRILAQAATVSEEDYKSVAAGLSYGGLHGTLVHILATEGFWLSRWQGRDAPEFANVRETARVAGSVLADFGAVQEAWQQNDAELAAFIAGLTDEATMQPADRPLWQLLAQLVNHGTQYRAEAAVRLSQLGCSPGDLDFIIYLRQRAQT